MPQPVAHEWLEAEAQSFPFASTVAFALQPTALRRRAAGVLDGGPTGRLATALEERLRPRAHGLSLDVLRQLRDATWFHEEALSTPLAAYLARLARAYLTLDGGGVALARDRDAAHKAARWRWLSLHLPADLLVAALAADAEVEPPPERVQLATPHLSQILQRPCAETHLHVGAALTFPLLWASLMRGLADNPPEASALGRSPPIPFGDGAGLLAMLLGAATSRLLLAAFLMQRTSASRFVDFLGRDGQQSPLARIAARTPFGWGADACRRELLRALGQLVGTAAPARPALARLLYARLCGVAPRGVDPARPSWAAAAMDPLAAWLPPGPGLAFPETRFAYRALCYLLRSEDEVFARFFFQYQRVRCLLYRHLCEEPGTAGLDWFVRHYGRISALRGALDNAIFSCALEVQSAGLDLRALEARTAPDSTWVAVRDCARQLARQAERHQPGAGRSRPEVGLVLHFIKDWGAPRLHADPRRSALGCRHGAWFRDRRQQALAVATALRHHPELLLVLRGLDVANVELAQPTWLLPLLMGPVRAAAVHAAARLARARPRWQPAALRTTLHAGEDYRRLSEGLRRMHEPIACGLLGVGDRIGHGIALGEDAQRWALASRVVGQPVEERLDDLLWELDRYQHGELPAELGRAALVGAQIRELGALIYGRPAPVIEELLAARRLRHDAAALRRLNYPFLGPFSSGDQADSLLHRHLTDPAVFARGQRPIAVRADESEVAMLQAAQHRLREVLATMEITIESNPSSNLLIGDYLGVEEHPAFRLHPLPGAAVSPLAPVLLSVNTDNPVTFASCLADEFAHIYHALVRRGVAARDALHWLDQVRDNGWRSRFTIAASADPAALRELNPRS